jgi:serine/threonine protein phosphatase PrpC
MEDAHIAIEINLPKGEGKAMLFGVFDGHGGKEVAHFAEKHFKDILLAEPNFKQAKYDVALTEAFHILDSRV